MTSPTLLLLKLLRSVLKIHSTCSISLPSLVRFAKNKAQSLLTALGLSQAFVAWFANSSCLGDERQAVLQTIVASL